MVSPGGPGIEVDLRGVDRQTAGNPPGIGLRGGVPPRISPGARSGGCEGAAEEVSHRVVGGVAVWVCGVSGPAYRVAVGLEHLAVAGLKLGEGTSEDRGSSYPAGSIGSDGGWIRALCWVPMTERSPLSSGLVGAVCTGDKCPLSGHHQRGEEGRWSPPLSRRPLRIWWYKTWKVALRGRGSREVTMRRMGWRALAQNCCEYRSRCALKGRTQVSALRWDTAAFDDSRSRSSEPCSGSPQVYPGGRRTHR